MQHLRSIIIMSAPAPAKIARLEAAARQATHTAASQPAPIPPPNGAAGKAFILQDVMALDKNSYIAIRVRVRYFPPMLLTLPSGNCSRSHHPSGDLPGCEVVPPAETENRASRFISEYTSTIIT